MFIDLAKIYIKSGNGGDGAVSFRRELYVPTGGPDGGDGGDGGDVIFSIDDGLNTLLPFKHKFKYIAENGGNGQKKKCHGKNGKDLIIYVPNGTIIRHTDTGKIIFDMTDTDDKILLKGGRGGKGNQHFATSSMQAPRYAVPGGKGKELYITLELKSLADVGLVGFPNVGKSTIITKLTNAKPEIGNYHFTTLNPHLGICETDGKNIIIADIPGLIEGASDGMGLGINFLKHIERTKILLHIIDAAGTEFRDPMNDLKIINAELKKYNIEVWNKKQIIVLNKIDLIDNIMLQDLINKIRQHYTNEIICISAKNEIGLQELKKIILKCLEEESNKTKQIFEPEINVNTLFENSDEKINIEKINSNVYKVFGAKIDKMFGYTNIETEKGMNFFQQFLKNQGIIDDLKKKGMVEGDTLIVGDIEFEYYE